MWISYGVADYNKVMENWLLHLNVLPILYVTRSLKYPNKNLKKKKIIFVLGKMKQKNWKLHLV